MTGQQADATGHRRRSLAIFSALVAVSVIGLFWVRDDYHYFFLGAALIGLGSIFFEIAAVFYNSMLRQISTPANIGRISGFGWSMGYFGGIFLLLFCYFGFISGDGDTRGFLNVSTAGGYQHPVGRTHCGRVVLGLRPARAVQDPGNSGRPETATGVVPRRLPACCSATSPDWSATIGRPAPSCLASAIFRDGLAGVFHFGAILAASVYGFTSGNVLIFGAVANIVAALGALVAGRFDDRVGPKAVIVIALLGLLVSGFALLFVSGQGAFWVLGLLLCLFVGPAQSSSRTFMARLTKPGNEGQMFGLYATTGRAVSFLSPLALRAVRRRVRHGPGRNPRHPAGAGRRSG